MGKALVKKEKSKVPVIKEPHSHHNVTADKTSKPAKTTSGQSEISTARKSAVRYYQCVFVNGYNGYTSQYAVTPVQDNKGKTGQSKTSRQKIKAPKQ
nr:triadin-like [Anolis sagrei ordinatus]